MIATKHHGKIGNYIHTVSSIIDKDKKYLKYLQSNENAGHGAKHIGKKYTVQDLKKHVVKDRTTCTSIKKYIFTKYLRSSLKISTKKQNLCEITLESHWNENVDQKEKNK